MKPDAQQQKRKSDDELKQEYRAPYASAVKSLFTNQRDPERARLGKRELAAILTLGFGQVTRHASKNLGELRETVKRKLAAEIDKYNVPAFFVDLDKLKDDAEALRMLCGSSSPTASAAGHAAPPAPAEASAGLAVPPALAASLTTPPPPSQSQCQSPRPLQRKERRRQNNSNQSRQGSIKQSRRCFLRKRGRT